MSKELINYITEASKKETPGPGRFFTKYKGDFIVGDNDLLVKYDTILMGIGEGKPDLKLLDELIKLIDSSLDGIFKEMENNAPSITIGDTAKGDIKYSFMFKLSSVFQLTNMNEMGKKDNKDTLQTQFMEENSKGKVLIGVAGTYFRHQPGSVEKKMSEYYTTLRDTQYEGASQSIKGDLLGNDIDSLDDFIEKTNWNNSASFKAIPESIKEEITTTLYDKYKEQRIAKQTPQKNNFDTNISVLKGKIELMSDEKSKKALINLISESKSNLKIEPEAISTINKVLGATIKLLEGKINKDDYKIEAQKLSAKPNAVMRALSWCMKQVAKAFNSEYLLEKANSINPDNKISMDNISEPADVNKAEPVIESLSGIFNDGGEAADKLIETINGLDDSGLNSLRLTVDACREFGDSTSVTIEKVQDLADKLPKSSPPEVDSTAPAADATNEDTVRASI